MVPIAALHPGPASSRLILTIRFSAPRHAHAGASFSGTLWQLIVLTSPFLAGAAFAKMALLVTFARQAVNRG
jgi:hypothetical protein